MFFDIKATSLQGIEYELTEAILKKKTPYFAIPPRQYLFTTMGLGIQDFQDPARAGREMVRKMIRIGRLREKQMKVGGRRPVVKGSAFFHHATWVKYRECESAGRLLNLNKNSLHAITVAMSQLTLGVAKQFWTRFILEDMVALPYGVERIFFAETSEPEPTSPFGNCTAHPVCIVNAEKMLQPMLRVLHSSRNTDGRNIKNARRATEANRLASLQYWGDATASATLDGAIDSMKEILSSTFRAKRVALEFTEPTAMHPSWDKQTDYKYFRWWEGAAMTDERRKELYLPALKQVKVDMKARKKAEDKMAKATAGADNTESGIQIEGGWLRSAARAKVVQDTIEKIKDGDFEPTKPAEM
jgi:hypothetical protein